MPLSSSAFIQRSMELLLQQLSVSGPLACELPGPAFAVCRATTIEHLFDFRKVCLYFEQHPFQTLMLLRKTAVLLEHHVILGNVGFEATGILPSVPGVVPFRLLWLLLLLSDRKHAGIV